MAAEYIRILKKREMVARIGEQLIRLALPATKDSSKLIELEEICSNNEIFVLIPSTVSSKNLLAYISIKIVALPLAGIGSDNNVSPILVLRPPRYIYRQMECYKLGLSYEEGFQFAQKDMV